MKTELNNIGTWGRLHYDFLYRNQRSVINAMGLTGTLHEYSAKVEHPYRFELNSAAAQIEQSNRRN